MFIKWFENTRNWKFSYEIKLSDTGHEGKWENKVLSLLCRTWISFRYFWLVGKHSRMPSGLFSYQTTDGRAKGGKGDESWEGVKLMYRKVSDKKLEYIYYFLFACLIFFGGAEGRHSTIPASLSLYCLKSCLSINTAENVLIMRW